MSGWSPITDTWTYNSTDNPTGVINWSGANSKVSVGMRIRFNNGGNTINGIVTAVTGSTMTFLHEMNEANNNAVHLMANSAITNPYISAHKAPLGFNVNPDRWSVMFVGTAQVGLGSTGWSVASGNNLTVPIGAWNLSYKCCAWLYGGVGALDVYNLDALITLTAEISSETSKSYTYPLSWRSKSAKANSVYFPVYMSNTVNCISKTTYYISGKLIESMFMYLRGDVSLTKIQATCAYL